MFLGMREISTVVCLVQLYFRGVESTVESGVLSATGKVVMKFPHHNGKTRTSNDSIHLFITSSIYNGMVPLLMDRVHIPFTYRNNITGTFSTAYETPSCYYKAHEVTFGTFSLCFGIKGYLRFSTFGIHLESQKPSDDNFLAKLALRSTHDVNIIREDYQDYRHQNLRRFKRETKEVRFSASTPFVVKLFIVYQDELAKKFGLQKFKDRVMHIMKIVNGAYHELGIAFAIVGFEKFPRYLGKSPAGILSILESYKREKDEAMKADCLHLISGDSYSVRHGERVGRATNEKMCSVDLCVGFSFDNPKKSVRHMALVVAHELGHNFGVAHDQQNTDCQSCIMSPLINFDKMKLSWSQKSRETIEDIMAQGLDKCLRNDNYKPKKLVTERSYCGNGIVERGEECDCGSLSSCSRNKCCDGRSCRFVRGATCATGACCDISTCHFKLRSTSCRPAAGKCDLPEFCDGETEFCPTDVYHLNGRPCDNQGQAYCVNGTCESSHSRCQAIWGHTAIVGNDECFDKNLETHHFGHCKQTSITRIPSRQDNYPFAANKENQACRRRDKMCGRLWCDHKNLKPMIYGVLGVFDFYSSGKLCAAAVVDLGANVREYGLVPDGAKCGDDKMCSDSRCITVKNMHKGLNCTCNNRGVCNSRGNCHCNYGFKPPDCMNEGTGGSIDSGPPPKNWQSLPPVVVVLIILTILIIAVIGFVALVCVKKRHKLAQMKFRYRSVPSSKPPATVECDVEYKNTSNGTVHTNTKVNTHDKYNSPPKTKTVNGPPPRPPPKPNSLTINVNPDEQTGPSPDTPPLPPYPNEYAIPNGQLSEETDKTKTRPKISSPIFQTSTNLDLGNIPHVETTVKKKNATSRNSSSAPKPGNSKDSSSAPKLETSRNPSSASKPGISRNPSSAPKPGTSRNQSSLLKPGTSGDSSSDPKPGTSRNPSSAPKPGTSRNQSSLPKPGTSGDSSTPKPVTSRNQSSLPKPGTSGDSSSAPKPGTFRNQSFVPKPGISGNPSSAPKPAASRNPSFVPKSGTSRNPSFVPTPPKPTSNHQPPPPPPPSYTKPSLPPAKKPIFRP